MGKMIICKFCGYKPNLPVKRMLIWGADLCCDTCFIAKLNNSQPQGYKQATEASGDKV